MPARVFPALQFRIIELMEEEELTAEEVVTLSFGTAIGKLKTLPPEQAKALALEIITALHKHIFTPDAEPA